jgi:hypothetical protein
MVPKSGVIELRRVERLYHLAATVKLAMHAGTQRVSRQHKEDRALIGQPFPDGGYPRETTQSAGRSVRRVHVVDQQKADRIKRYRWWGAAHTSGNAK